MRSRHALIAIMVLPAMMAGCASAPPTIRTQIVHVPITTYVPIPAALTQPCPIAEPTTDTVAEAVSVAHARKVSLIQCNAQLDGIRTIGDTTKQP